MERKAVHVDSVCPLIVNLKAIKRTELLTEHNSPENFFRATFCKWFNCNYNCDDHISISHNT